MSKIGIDIDCPFANDNWGTHILEDLRGECQRDIPALVKVINERLFNYVRGNEALSELPIT